MTGQATFAPGDNSGYADTLSFAGLQTWMVGMGTLTRRIAAAGIALTCLACLPGAAAAETGAMSDGTRADEGLRQALRRHVQMLSVDIGERSVVRGDGLDRARSYIAETLRAAGLSVREQDYAYNVRRVANLIADPPEAPADRAPLLVGAHYDTVVGTPGADDNASGVAVLLELARWAAAQRPAAAVRFVAFTLEEPPNFGSRLQGSRVFVRDLVENRGTIQGAIILEMVGFTTPKQEYPLVLRWAGYPEAGDFIGVVGNRASRPFGARVLKAMRRNAALPLESLFIWFNGWVLPDTRLSDHASFWDEELPALMVTDTAYFRNPNYHTLADRAETLDYGFMAKLVESLTLVLDEVAAGE